MEHTQAQHHAHKADEETTTDVATEVSEQTKEVQAESDGLLDVIDDVLAESEAELEYREYQRQLEKAAAEMARVGGCCNPGYLPTHYRDNPFPHSVYWDDIYIPWT